MTEATNRTRHHDPGVILTQLAVMLVDGGDCLSDLQTLRSEARALRRGGVAPDRMACGLVGVGD
jgi:hypothetical protein